MKKVDWILIICAFVLTALMLRDSWSKESCTKDSCGPMENYVTISVNNPYSIEIEAEIKCDWNTDLKDFEIKYMLLFQPNSSTIVRIPNKTKLCEVWTHANFF